MAPAIKQKANKSSKKTNNVAPKEKAVSGQLQKKINKKQPAKDERGVIFIKHLPHGFFEQQLQKYFEQFGKVTRLRLARSKKTGGSKGYAFVEFEYPEVAQVAAETMNNYLMFQKVVKAAYIPPEKQQYNFFKSTLRAIKNKSGKTVWVSSKTAALQRKVKQHNDWSEENFQKRTSKQLNKLQKLNKKCAHLGIDIDKIINGGSAINVGVDKDEAAGDNSKKNKKLEKETSSVRKQKTKQPKLEDLLGNTLPEDSEDEDYIAVSKGIDEKETSGVRKQKTKQPKLEDLLGNTLPEDSEDEDYMAVSKGNDESIEEEASSDEESYDFLKDIGEMSESSEDNVDDAESAEKELQIPAKKSKAKFSKSLKTSNSQRFDKILKRKPQTGRVQKTNKKPIKQTTTVKAKKEAQLSQAKEIAKPLGKLKKKSKKVK